MVKFAKSLGIKSIGVDGDNSIIREIEDTSICMIIKGFF